MATTKRGRARPISVIAALGMIVLFLGVGGPALADPGNAKGAEQSQSAKQGTDASASTNSDESTKAQGKSADAPGQNKSDSSSTDASDHTTSGTAGTSGDVSSPQPISNADANKGGANGQCPGGAYCSTRDGSPSLNGNGNGKATGKPCAGCVGKADNKNPKGQRPNGSDHNAGYECDRNHGIGRSNPAHTGCTTPVTPPPPPPVTCADKPSMPGCETPPPPPSTCADKPNMPGCETPPPPPSTCADKPNMPECEVPVPPVPPTTCDDGSTPPCPVPPKNRPPVKIPVDIAGVQTEVPPASAVASTPPAAVLPATGAPQMMGWFGGSGVVLVLVGGLTLWLQRRMRSVV
jgi:LPXTG-motif cell wall-anchored protein